MCQARSLECDFFWKKWGEKRDFFLIDVLWYLRLASVRRDIWWQLGDRACPLNVNVLCPHVNIFHAHTDVFYVLVRFQVYYLALLLCSRIFFLLVFPWQLTHRLFCLLLILLRLGTLFGLCRPWPRRPWQFGYFCKYLYTHYLRGNSLSYHHFSNTCNFHECQHNAS